MNLHSHPIAKKEGIYSVTLKTDMDTENHPRYVVDNFEYKNKRWVDVETNYPGYYVFLVKRKINS